MDSFQETARRFPKPGSCLSFRRDRSDAGEPVSLDGHEGRRSYLTRGTNRLRDSLRRSPSAIRFLFERVNLVTEPSGASALTALMTGKVNGRDKRVGVTISGGNIGLDEFCQIVAEHGG